MEEEKIVYCSDTLCKNRNLKASTDNIIAKLVNIDLSKTNTFLSDEDDKDVIIEEEIIVYNEIVDQTPPMINVDSKSLLHSKVITLDSYIKCKSNAIDDIENAEDNKSSNRQYTQQEKLRYKRKYLKVDPNIIIEFAFIESNMLKALKILFDWLKVNSEVLINCFGTNPELIHKIIILLNYLNIDIFTNKVFFERSLIKVSGIRENLRPLFDCISTIPIHEDLLLKQFTILNDIQIHLDWKAPLKLNLNSNEQHFLRIFKLVDFGFFICKMKKFRYNFCARSRLFMETVNQRKDRSKQMRKKYRDKKNYFSDKKSNKTEQHITNKRKHFIEKNVEKKIAQQEDVSEYDENLGRSLKKKTYLKNPNIETPLPKKENLPLTGNKYEIMGKLWLRDEVKTLETKIQKPKAMTPYLVMDSKSLTDYTSVVKFLIKTREFIILIPTAGKYFISKMHDFYVSIYHLSNGDNIDFF